jgi:hypothetical protein
MGGVNIAVVELFNPVFDPASPGVTYDIGVLRSYQTSSEFEFREAPMDLSSLPEQFGATHLFIDDCPDKELFCTNAAGDRVGTFGSVGHCYYWNEIACVTCGSENFVGAVNHWTTQCNDAFPACDGQCRPEGVCSSGVGC